MKNQINNWAQMILEESKDYYPQSLNEGIKNKILGWLGVRSNYEEFENFVDDIVSGKAKDRDARRFVYRIESDDKFNEMLKSLPRNFDEDDLIPTIRDILRNKMNKNISDKRYQKAIKVIAKVLYTAIQADREQYRKEEAEYQAERAARNEKEKKAREAEYWEKHGTGIPFSGGWQPDNSAKWSEPTWRDDEYAAGRLEESDDSVSKERTNVGNVIVEFSTPTESGMKSVQKLMSPSELETWIKKIGEEKQLQDLYLELSSKDETSIRLKPIEVHIRHN